MTLFIWNIHNHHCAIHRDIIIDGAPKLYFLLSSRYRQGWAPGSPVQPGILRAVPVFSGSNYHFLARTARKIRYILLYVYLIAIILRNPNIFSQLLPYFATLVHISYNNFAWKILFFLGLEFSIIQLSNQKKISTLHEY